MNYLSTFEKVYLACADTEAGLEAVEAATRAAIAALPQRMRRAAYAVAVRSISAAAAEVVSDVIEGRLSLPDPTATATPTLTPSARVIFTPTSSNRKTGNVPTAWVGRTEEEALASCSGCALRPTRDGGDGSCYAWSGAVRFGAISARKAAAARPETRTLPAALAGAARSARMLRLTGIGDIGRSGRAVADQVVNQAHTAGLAVVGYTHHWRENEVADAWRGRLMASTESAADADAAVAAGWRATVVVAPDAPRVSTTPAGRRVVVCPAQVAGEGREVTCNTCRLCDASRLGPVIAFRAHGNGARPDPARKPAGARWSEVSVPMPRDGGQVAV